jgi:tetratricopeptide (TPR) repeat protein
VLVLSIYALSQFFYLSQAPQAFFPNKNLLAATINLLFFVGLYYFFKSNKPLFFFAKGLALLLLCYALFVISSRAAIIGFWLSLLLFVGLSYRRVNFKKLSLLIGMVALAYALSWINPVASPGFASLQSLVFTTHCRFMIWEQTWQLIQHAPWLGHGLGAFPWLYNQARLPLENCSSGFYAHNDYLQFAFELGIPSIIILFLLILSFCKKQFFQLKVLADSSKNEATAIFCGLLAVCLQSFFTYNFSIPSTLILLGIFIARYYYLSSDSNKQLSISALVRPYIFYPVIIILLLLSFIASGLLAANYLTYQKARKEFALGHITYAMQLANKAIKLWPYEQTPYQFLLKQTTEILLVSADNHNPFSQLVYQQAINDFNHLISANPYNDMAYLYRAKLAESYGKPNKESAISQAKAAYQTALQLNPRNIYARLGYAQLLEKQGDIKSLVIVLFNGRVYRYPATEEKQVNEYRELLRKYTRSE